ncbi:MAG: 30S ribosomal protein S8 [Actinobacteria bacterium]|nr:30S ribosomal protein S8 [Actinomycetota bacterium]MCB9389853.1 30S ribosomal protein S8 [Acidimicrobiia bacterium]
MSMTDPIADMLTRIRNANIAYHDTCNMPLSKQKAALAAVLKSEGYIADFSADNDPGTPGAVLSIELKYTVDRKRTISGIKRISKPGLRVYAKSNEIPRVLGGLGTAILSTSHGLLTDREARRQKVGGEILCHVW